MLYGLVQIALDARALQCFQRAHFQMFLQIPLRAHWLLSSLYTEHVVKSDENN
jgi:hypothetical protein